MINYLLPYKSEQTVDLHNILDLCCQGRSVGYISRAVGQKVEFVMRVLLTFFGFYGLLIDFDCDFRAFYKRCGGDRWECTSAIRLFNTIDREEALDLLFEANQKLDTIERTLDERN